MSKMICENIEKVIPEVLMKELDLDENDAKFAYNFIMLAYFGAEEGQTIDDIEDIIICAREINSNKT